jgi:hypothetical protein
VNGGRTISKPAEGRREKVAKSKAFKNGIARHAVDDDGGEKQWSNYSIPMNRS